MVKTESSVVSFSALVLVSTIHGLLIHLHEVGTSIYMVTKRAEDLPNTQEYGQNMMTRSKTNNESKNQSGRTNRSEFCLWGQNAQISPFLTISSTTK